MADTPWTVVAWQPRDAVTTSKLQQMVNNIDWLRQTTARARYRFAVTRDTGVQIIAGVGVIPKQSDSYGSTKVDFGTNIFTVDSRPIVTNGIYSPHRRVHVTLTGDGQLLPDERGFIIHAQMDNPNTNGKKNVLDSKIFVPWIAMGY